MRLTIRHETRYTYSEPAASAIQSLRLTPRSHDGQFVRRWRIDVSADARLERREDGYGNIVHTVFVQGPLDELLIVAEGDVDTDDRHGIAIGTAERQPLALFLRATSLTHATPEIVALAHGAITRQSGNRLAALHDLLGTLFSDIDFRPGETTTRTTAGDALQQRSGVCQDFAHIFLAAARAIGIPARYVSGHYLRTDGPDQSAGHAWAEAHIDGIGWIGFDPANGVCVTDRHVRIAIGCDGLDAAPVRGARTGGFDEKLTVSVTVAERGAALAQMPPRPDKAALNQSQAQAQSQT
jgi:transglutaminase-like putative cysteine protease